MSHDGPLAGEKARPLHIALCRPSVFADLADGNVAAQLTYSHNQQCGQDEGAADDGVTFIEGVRDVRAEVAGPSKERPGRIDDVRPNAQSAQRRVIIQSIGDPS